MPKVLGIDLGTTNSCMAVIEAGEPEVIENIVTQYIMPGSLEEQWDPDGLGHALESDFSMHMNISGWLKEDSRMNEDQIRDRCINEIQESYDDKVKTIGASLIQLVEKEVMLKQLDFHWKEHLGAMDYLRQGVGLRSYAQKNPKQEYKREAFEMFGEMLEQVKHDTISILSRVRIQSEEDVQRMEEERRMAKQLAFKHDKMSTLANKPDVSGGKSPALPDSADSPAAAAEPFVRKERKIGRNEACPCGSGKKYKQCHGKLS